MPRPGWAWRVADEGACAAAAAAVMASMPPGRASSPLLVALSRAVASLRRFGVGGANVDDSGGSGSSCSKEDGGGGRQSSSGVLARGTCGSCACKSASCLPVGLRELPPEPQDEDSVLEGDRDVEVEGEEEGRRLCGEPPSRRLAPEGLAWSGETRASVDSDTFNDSTDNAADLAASAFATAAAVARQPPRPMGPVRGSCVGIAVIVAERAGCEGDADGLPPSGKGDVFGRRRCCSRCCSRPRSRCSHNWATWRSGAEETPDSFREKNAASPRRFVSASGSASQR